MSLQVDTTPPPPSGAFPISILVAFALEISFSVARLGIPKDWAISEKYFLISSGIWAASALLVMMGLAELVRRLPEPRAAGARLAMVAYAVLLGLALATGVINYLGSNLGGKAELIWKIQSYAYFVVALTGTIGIILAAGGFSRVAVPAIAAVVVTLLLTPPPFLAEKLYALLGSSYRHAYLVGNLVQLALHALLLREAARSSARDLPLQPTAPFALLGFALRARVIAMFVLIGFTLFAVGGKSMGAMKLAMVGAPLINMGAFLVFAVAALRAARGLDAKLQGAFAIAGGASAWCVGVLAVQVPALYQMLKEGNNSFSSERSAEMAQALTIAMPLIATISVVIALVAVGTHVRRIGHLEIAETIVPRTTLFVALMIASVLIQIYGVPKARSVGQFVGIGVVAAVCGVAALLVAANSFKRASEATSTSALPTATMLPPS